MLWQPRRQERRVEQFCSVPAYRKKTVQAAGVNWCSAAALMRNEEVEAQAWADSHPVSLII